MERALGALSENTAMLKPRGQFYFFGIEALRHGRADRCAMASVINIKTDEDSFIFCALRAIDDRRSA